MSEIQIINLEVNFKVLHRSSIIKIQFNCVNKVICSPKFSEQLFASILMLPHSVVIVFPKKTASPAVWGNVSIMSWSKHFIQQMVILAVHSFWFLWAWVLNTSISANHFLTSKRILIRHVQLLVFLLTFSEHWHLQT